MPVSFRFPGILPALPVMAAALALALPAPLHAQSRFEQILQKFERRENDEGIYRSNGRVEAQTTDVATKYAGRISSVAVGEGDLVGAGDVLGQLETRDAEARVQAARAAVLQARAAKSIAEATLMQAQSALSVAETSHDRVRRLQESGTAAQSSLDDATNRLNSARATVEMARAQIEEATASIAAAEAEAQQARNALEDLTITAPIRGRILYRLHEPGEVLAAGAPLVTMQNVSDVYMNIYLPARIAGTLQLGDDARLILDPIPDYVIPARVTFISPQSQFTPKNVETREQREELVFRVKLSVPRDLLESFEDQIKSGVRGIGFVSYDPDAAWPEDLTVKLPQSE